MNRGKVELLGPLGFSRSINPLRRVEISRSPIVGFDTEYTSKGAELLSVQLWHKDRGAFIPFRRGEKLTANRLYQECLKLIGEIPDRRVFLVTYFSLAELQFLPVVSEGFDVREYANGSLDVAFAAPWGKVEIYDLARWFGKISLSRAAESFGLEKLEYDTKNVTRVCLKQKKFREYALHDAKLCHDIMESLRAEFIAATGVDPIITKTPASTSASAFRNLHCRKKFYCDENEARRTALEGCWGGHAEVFKRGRLKGVYTEWDFKSAYPTAAIKIGEMPVQGSWKPVTTLRQVETWRGGFARVQFRFSKGERYPCLPVWSGNLLLYPLEGESCCTFEEIKVALEQNAEIVLIDAWGYRRGTRILADYLQWTLEERKKCTGARNAMFKLLGNSIIGKFAQAIKKIPIQSYFNLAEELDCYVDELFELSPHELHALGIESHMSVGPIFMPEWNGLITGYTRAALAEMLRSADDAIYCHTDSVWCKGRPTCERLPFDAKLSGQATIIRTRFAGLAKGRKFSDPQAHVAYHSVWNRQAAMQMLARFDGEDFSRRYPIRRPLKLRESIRTDRPVGTWVQEWRCGNTKWDGKRRLIRGGDTMPWRNVEEALDM